VTIPTGQSTATIWVDVLDESSPEGDENFFIHVSQSNTPLNSVVSQGVIYDEDVGAPQPPVGIVAILNAPPALEPSSGSASDATYAQFFVTYTNPSSQAASVEWYTESPNQGDATPNQDYYSASGTLTLDPTTGSPRTLGVPIQIKYDTVTPEPDEPFSVKLRNPSGVTIAPTLAEARGTISDRPPGTPVPLQITIQAPVPDADELGPSPAHFTVKRTGPIDQPYTVIYTIGGTATLNQDYYIADMNGVQVAGGLEDRVTIPANQSAVSFLAIPIQDNVTPETPNETIILTLSPSEPAGNPSSATANIRDAGDRVKIEVAPTTNENNSATVSFKISRGSTVGALNVNISRGGTATLGDDYYYVQAWPPGGRSFSPNRSYFPASVTIPDGASSVSFEVQIVDDWKIEDPDETIIVSVTGGSVTDRFAASLDTLTIIDDDEVATVSITPASQSVNEWGILTPR
jgi:hypothetical protein